MTQSVTESSISPSPLSPFSTYSVASGVTSDDAPDLGAFTTVFRALNNFNPRVQPNGPDYRGATPTSSFTYSQSDDSDPVPGPSGWAGRRVPSYRTTSLPGSPVRSHSVQHSESDATASDYDDGTELEVTIEDENTMDRPSLGYLDQTLTYIAAEREKLAARREFRGNTSTTSDSASPYVVPTGRRKRRRKRNRSALDPRRNAPVDAILTEMTGGEVDAVDEVSADNEDEGTSSSVEASSSSPPYKTTPATPAAQRKEKQKQRESADHNPRLHHSKSTPTLKPNPALHVMTKSFDARTIQLRTLAHKLRLLFKSESQALLDILSRDFTSTLTYADPRGPVPQSQDTLIHVFVDHSNILIGFITYVKRHLQHVYRKYKQAHLSHAALALVLERGRPVTRRVLVTSSPLYQSMHSAEELGYEVRIYARVPDVGDGADRQRHQHHSRNNSAGNTTHTAGASRARVRTTHARGLTHKPAPAPATANATNGNSTSTDSDGAVPVRYREQGVDELLQLKLHQAIAAVDVVPPGGTIVLATGDGNVGQFNEDGFLGCVRTALKKGWAVELYAWEGGLSRAWQREFGECEGFSIIMLDVYAADLLEIPDGVAA
ncbi:hypothetical protein C2E23DRAFT_737498 [Lenzites betulinus]|nr:hypothetical protein C2E23DRAFT_737498 [Lenzites betulinus]